MLWFEVWYSAARKDEIYLLVLVAMDDGTFEIRNPQFGWRTDNRYTSYEEASLSLGDDEFVELH